jgi:hypothetical protein
MVREGTHLACGSLADPIECCTCEEPMYASSGMILGARGTATKGRAESDPRNDTAYRFPSTFVPLPLCTLRRVPLGTGG